MQRTQYFSAISTASPHVQTTHTQTKPPENANPAKTHASNVNPKTHAPHVSMDDSTSATNAYPSAQMAMLASIKSVNYVEETAPLANLLRRNVKPASHHFTFTILHHQPAFQIAHLSDFIQTQTTLNAQAVLLPASLAQTHQQHAQAAPHQSFSSSPNASPNAPQVTTLSQVHAFHVLHYAPHAPHQQFASPAHSPITFFSTSAFPNVLQSIQS
jgi:hypothetical protein